MLFEVSEVMQELHAIALWRFSIDRPRAERADFPEASTKSTARVGGKSGSGSGRTSDVYSEGLFVSMFGPMGEGHPEAVPSCDSLCPTLKISHC